MYNLRPNAVRDGISKNDPDGEEKKSFKIFAFHNYTYLCLPKKNSGSVRCVILGARKAGVAQLVEQLICNQQVVGSTPFSGSDESDEGGLSPGFKITFDGRVVKWPTTTDCKSVLLRVRWFESALAHSHLPGLLTAVGEPGNLANVLFGNVSCGSSSVGRATAFQAVGRGFEPRLPLR